MDCLASILKYIIYVFNLIFVVCGLLLIIFGSVTLGNMGDFKGFEEVIDAKTIPILIIVLGSVIFIIAFFGCCGAIKENNCCTMIYAIFMFILLALQVALIIWVFVKRTEFLKTMGEVVDEAYKKNDQANGYPMDALQMTFKCCGVNNYTDYDGKVPNSCCGSMTDVCTSETYVTRDGCRQVFVDFWSKNMNIIRYAGLGVALVELIALIFACCLASSIRKSQSHNI